MESGNEELISTAFRLTLRDVTTHQRHGLALCIVSLYYHRSDSSGRLPLNQWKHAHFAVNELDYGLLTRSEEVKLA